MVPHRLGVTMHLHVDLALFLRVAEEIPKAGRDDNVQECSKKVFIEFKLGRKLRF